MSGSYCHVDFDGNQVSVSSDIPRVLDYIRGIFCEMLVSSAQSKAAEIKVERRNDEYLIQGDDVRSFPVAQESLMLEVLREEINTIFMRTRRDLFWIHAASVERNGTALVLAGPSGQGKSTLSTHLCNAGWRFMSDDITPMSMSANVVFPYLQLPRRRVYPGETINQNLLHTLEREEVAIDAMRTERKAATIAAIVFITFRGGAPAELRPVSRGDCAMLLLKSTSNFFDLGADGVTRAAGVARHLPAFSLQYGSAQDAVAILNNSFAT